MELWLSLEQELSKPKHQHASGMLSKKLRPPIHLGSNPQAAHLELQGPHWRKAHWCRSFSACLVKRQLVSEITRKRLGPCWAQGSNLATINFIQMWLVSITGRLPPHGGSAIASKSLWKKPLVQRGNFSRSWIQRIRSLWGWILLQPWQKAPQITCCFPSQESPQGASGGWFTHPVLQGGLQPPLWIHSPSFSLSWG